MSAEVRPAVEDLLGPNIGDATSREAVAVGEHAILQLSADELEPLSLFLHEQLGRCGGFTTHDSLDDARAALQADALIGTRLTGGLRLEPTQLATIPELIDAVDTARILSTITTLSAFPTRHYQSAGGVQAGEWLRDEWATMIAGRAGATAELYDHAGWAQSSVVLDIPGDENPDEIIVIGAHLDSISFGGGSAPGADDDASGVATMTEVARVLIEQDVRLKRTVRFIAYAAEEVGLRGSDEIAEEYAANGVNVLGAMQLDMTNYQGSSVDIVLIEDFVDAAQTDFLATLAATYLPELSVDRDECGYACSDHASWQRAGFPAVMPFEARLSEYNPTIHSSGDTLSVSGGTAVHATKFAKLALTYLVEMGLAADGPPTGTAPLVAQVAYDVAADPVGEFVDIANPTAGAVDLSGWTLSDDFDTWAFPAGTSVPAGGHLSLTGDAAGFAALYGVDPDVAGLTLDLSDEGDKLLLRDPTGGLVDHLAWEDELWPISAGTGQSLRRSATQDTDASADWSTGDAAPLGGQ